MFHRSVLAVSLGVVALLSACQAPNDTAQGVAERFLDRHYLAIDLHAARELCASVACSKLDAEIALTDEYAIDTATRKPTIEYTLAEAKQDDVAAMFQYTLSISSGGYDEYEKNVLLMLRNTNGVWQITNYDESDPPVRGAGKS